MKTFRFLFYVIFSAVVTLFVSSCKSDSENQGDHIEHTAEALKNAIGNAEKMNVSYKIVDYRSKEAYDAGHIPGAVWITEGTNTNMGNGTFAAMLKAKYGVNTVMFLCGGGNSALNMTMAGSVSSAGFGYQNSRTLVGGFDAWKKQGYEVETIPHYDF